jgi:hypothetical protein
MWVLLLLGLLPLAILPSMLDGVSGGGGADDDDSDDNAALAETVSDSMDGGWMPDAGPEPAPTAPDPGLEAPADSGEEGDEPPDFVATTFAMAPGDGIVAFADFVPGEDRVEFHIDPNGPEPELTSGQGGDGAWVRVAQGDAMAEARFPGLTEPPLGDIHLVSGVLDPDLSDDLPTDASEPDDADQAAPLLPVTDDVDEPGGADPDNGAPVLSPVVPSEGGS